MVIYREDTKLAEIIFREPAVITILNRFGIYLGVGNLSVWEACQKHGVDSVFLLAILNTYLNEDYFPEKVLMSSDMNKILDYLRETNRYYKEFQLPNIDRHFSSLIRQSNSENNNLGLLRGFFEEMRDELIGRISRDEAIFSRISSTDCNFTLEEFHNLGIQDEENSVIEDKISDLLSFFIIHLSGDYNRNLCQAVVSALFTLGKDVRQNNRIRSRMLSPMLENMISCK